MSNNKWAATFHPQWGDRDVLAADPLYCNCNHTSTAHDQGPCRFCMCGGFVAWGTQ